MIRLIALMIFVGIAVVSPGQVKTDSSKVSADTSVHVIDSVQRIKSFAARYDPRKALLYAAVLPGSGQIYNRKYWKVPLVYGGFGLLIYSVNFYQNQYKIAKSELFMAINSDDPNFISPHGFTEAQLRTITDQVRRQRDFFMVMTGLLYILQMVDAHVDAHLKEFDINPSLRVRVEPRIMQTDQLGRSAGVSLYVRF